MMRASTATHGNKCTILCILCNLAVASGAAFVGAGEAGGNHRAAGVDLNAHVGNTANDKGEPCRAIAKRTTPKS